MHHRWRTEKRRYYLRCRRLREREAVTPYPGPHGTRWAIPYSIVACESHGDYHAHNPASSAAGAYQIEAATWTAYGGGAYAPTADAAPPYAQDIIAHRIWVSDGPGAWACA